MRREILKLVLFLLAGAIINVAVAWGCVVAMTPRGAVTVGWIQTVPAHFQVREPLGWRILRDDGFGWTRVESTLVPFSQAASRLNPTREEMELVSARSRSIPPHWSSIPQGELRDARVAACGWPMRCLWYAWSFKPRSTSTWAMPPAAFEIEFERALKLPKFVAELTLGGALPTTWSGGDVRGLAYRPIWRGFVVNTIMYAAVVWIVFAAPAALRRKLRLRRGLCVKCGYALRGSASGVCSECGAASER